MNSPNLQYPAQFSRSLAFLYGSGYPLGNAFKLLGMGMENSQDRLVCLNLFAQVRKGRSLVESFRTCRFPATLLGALEAGEASGNLDCALMWVADFEERNQEIRRQLKEALIYPAVTLGFTFLVAVLLPPLVVRDQLLVLSQNGGELPLLSQMLLAFSDVVTHPLMLFTPLLAWKLGRWLKARWHTARGRHLMEGLLLGTPWLGLTYRRATSARALALMALFFRAGASPLKALRVAGEGCGSQRLQEQLASVEAALKGGEGFGSSLSSCDWFSDSTQHLVLAGEVVGDPGRMLELSSGLEEESMRDALRMFAAALQPLVMLVVGVIVCLTLIAVLGPSVSLISHL